MGKERERGRREVRQWEGGGRERRRGREEGERNCTCHNDGSVQLQFVWDSQK